MKKIAILSFFAAVLMSVGPTTTGVLNANTSIPMVFTEDFGGPQPGFRFKIRDVRIMDGGNSYVTKGGGVYRVSMDVLHDCISCGNAVNQVIVGLGGEKTAQVSVWNGKQRSGGRLMVVNAFSGLAAPAEDNAGPAEWVRVFFKIRVPAAPGDYYLRARYAQAYQGNVLTAEGLKIKQPLFKKVLGWWRVDRPAGPGPESNIGVFHVN